MRRHTRRAIQQDFGDIDFVAVVAGSGNASKIGGLTSSLGVQDGLVQTELDRLLFFVNELARNYLGLTLEFKISLVSNRLIRWREDPSSFHWPILSWLCNAKKEYRYGTISCAKTANVVVSHQS
jgi:hypothetical protein